MEICNSIGQELGETLAAAGECSVCDKCGKYCRCNDNDLDDLCNGCSKDEIMQIIEEKIRDKDKQVFVITIEDIIGCIVDVYGKDLLNFSDDKLDEAIQSGVKATERIDWATTISWGLPPRSFYKLPTAT